MAYNRNEHDTKYRKENTKNMIIRFYLNTEGDSELLEYANSQENRNAYIKRLIRQDMERDS